MTLKELKAYLPGWIRVDSPMQHEWSVYYITGDIEVGKYGQDPWVSADVEFRVTFIGEREGKSKFKFIGDRTAVKGPALLFHIDRIEEAVRLLKVDTNFAVPIIRDIFLNPGKYD